MTGLFLSTCKEEHLFIIKDQKTANGFDTNEPHPIVSVSVHFVVVIHLW